MRAGHCTPCESRGIAGRVRSWKAPAMPRAIELIVRSLALHDEAAIDRDDLRLLTPKQRLEGLEALRRAYFGYGDNPP